MSTIRFSPGLIVYKLRGANVVIAEGRTVAQACNHFDGSGFWYYRRRCDSREAQCIASSATVPASARSSTGASGIRAVPRLQTRDVQRDTQAQRRELTRQLSTLEE